jgi:hypothetical protein
VKEFGNFANSYAVVAIAEFGIYLAQNSNIFEPQISNLPQHGRETDFVYHSSHLWLFARICIEGSSIWG